MDDTQRRPAPRIAIIGSGFSGLCLGIHLKRAGIQSFTIYEKAAGLGGTWRDNTYPGAACDLPSFAYCFSFEQKTDWSRKWSPQREILEYMEHCAEKYGLLPHIRFNTEIGAARFDATAGAWHLRTTGGEEIVADVLVSGVGQLSRPYTPKLPGCETFEGESFHSARWNHEYDLRGKDVAVIGNAASAIQFIPEVARVANTVYVFQRSANWMLQRFDRSYRPWEKTLFQRVPGLARLYRWWIWSLHELGYTTIVRPHTTGGRRVAKKAVEYIRAEIPDPQLQQALIPDYPVGGRRVLISDDYYPALRRGNVHVVTSGIDHVTRDAVVTKDGTTHRVDAIIFGTGFESTAFLAPMRIEGVEGRLLDDAWKDGAEAYLGLTVAGFPNFFLMYGPNTNLGHNSIIFMIECQTSYIMDAIRHLMQDDLKYLDVRPPVMAAFNQSLQRELANSNWALTDHSWYKNAAGKITNNWPGSTIRYWWRTRRVDLADYRTARREDRGEAPAAIAA
jgi:cation diffusion facilitator CzcD-associated flavoprotein CzcO